MDIRGGRRTIHIQIASNLFLGGGSSNLFHTRAQNETTQTGKVKKNARHSIKFSHVSDKVHVFRTDGTHAHDGAGGEVEHGEEHDRQVVGHKGGRAPVAPQEDFPGAKLWGDMTSVEIRTKSNREEKDTYEEYHHGPAHAVPCDIGL